jgi:hypothetical protein
VGILLYLLVMFVLFSHGASVPVVLYVAALASLVPLLSHRHASMPFAALTAFLVGAADAVLEAVRIPWPAQIDPLAGAEVLAAVVAACACATLLKRRDDNAGSRARPLGGGA